MVMMIKYWTHRVLKGSLTHALSADPIYAGKCERVYVDPCRQAAGCVGPFIVRTTYFLQKYFIKVNTISGSNVVLLILQALIVETIFYKWWEFFLQDKTDLIRFVSQT